MSDFRPLWGGGVRRLMAKAILNFHFDYLNPSLTQPPIVYTAMIIINVVVQVHDCMFLWYLLSES